MRAIAAALFLHLFTAPSWSATKAAYTHYMKAVMLQHQGEYAQALAEYETAAQLDPQSSYIMEQAAELALEIGQTQQALTLAKKLVNLEPNAPKARLLLGNIHWARAELVEAQAAFEEALKLKPNYSEALFALGNLLNTQSPEKAKKYLESYLAANPEHAAEAHYQIAFVEQRQGRLDSAVSHLESAIVLDPSFLQARYSLAHIYEVRKDTDAALAEYLGILERDDDNVALLNHIGELYFLKKDIGGAKEYFTRAKGVASHNPDSCFWLAILAEQAGDFSAAADYLADSSAIKQQAELSLRLSYYLTQANRLKEAMKILQEAYQRWPENNDIAYFLALGFDDLKSYEEAIKLLKQVLARDPASRDARFQLATLYEKLGRIEDAEREFLALLEQKPNDASALNYLGYSLTDRGLKLAEAEQYIRRALAVEPTNAAYLDSLGWSHYKQGRSTEALSELRLALDQLPTDPTVWDHVGDVENALGNPVEAWRAWRKSQAFQPANEALQKKIAAVEGSFSNKDLGERLLESLKGMQGSIASFGGPCEISGKVWNKDFAFSGILLFRDGALHLDVLGPMFVPMFQISMTSSSFAMDAIPLDGVSPDALRAGVEQGFGLMRDYLTGAVFSERPAEFNEGWRTQWIATPAYQLYLNDQKQFLKSFKRAEGVQGRLSLDGYQWMEDKQIPTIFKLEGKGFSFQINAGAPSVRFQ